MEACVFWRRAPRRSRGQRGQVAVILAFLITFIILMLGLVIDSVRLYILGTQAIRAAEAGALAGALYMPDYFDSNPPSLTSPDGNTAVSRACLAVQQNGITNCPASAGVDGAMVSRVTGNPYEIQVTVTLTANVFFLDYVIPNLSTATVSRSSIAQYLPPIELGSRSSSFGDEADGVQSFWARLNGPSSFTENGDAFTPTYLEGPTDPINFPDASSPIYVHGDSPTTLYSLSLQKTNQQQYNPAITNPYQQPAGFTDKDGTPGYTYEIYIPPGVGNVALQIYNPAFDPTAAQGNNNGQDDLGAAACDDPAYGALGACTSTSGQSEYLSMHYSLYYTPLPFERSADVIQTLSNGSTEFSPPSLDFIKSDVQTRCGINSYPGKAYDPVSTLCVTTPGYVYDANAKTATMKDWYTLATITNPGTYRLTVAAKGKYGEHIYGLKLTDSSSTLTCASNTTLCPATDGPKIWAWGDECVYFTVTGTNTTFDLGEIPAAYAGKTLNFSLFDPGDGSGNVSMSILDPSGNAVQLPSWVRTVAGSNGTQLAASINGDVIYNGQWLNMPITIPANYNPAPGSDWWQIQYVAGTPNDTITISVSLSGNPVHLISEVL